MWLYTIDGFYSVVHKPGDTELTIRARVRADLERLKIHYLPLLSELTESDDSDYRFRAKATHIAFAKALYRIVQDIEYDNFKNTVAARQGTERAKIYSSVWSSTAQLGKLKDELSEKDKHNIPHGFSPTTSQRTMMRALYQTHIDEPMYTWRCMPFYAAAEKLGIAKRESNTHNISPEKYAEALYHDGYNKDWIKEPLTESEWKELFRIFVYQFLYDETTIHNTSHELKAKD